jgi:SAM-dependent methyltransferase
VRACGVRPGDRVLDVAAGSGNTAIRAADAGAHVVAADITPDGLAAEFFGVFGPDLPPDPPGAASPLAWGSEEQRELFGAGSTRSR